jgi:hypothetical protein
MMVTLLALFDLMRLRTRPKPPRALRSYQHVRLSALVRVSPSLSYVTKVCNNELFPVNT